MECQTCGGDRIIGIKDYPSTQPIDCPDCTPENVDSPTVVGCKPRVG